MALTAGRSVTLTGAEVRLLGEMLGQAVVEKGEVTGDVAGFLKFMGGAAVVAAEILADAHRPAVRPFRGVDLTKM